MNMKKIFIITAVIFSAIVWQACQDDDLEIGTPASSIEGLTKSPWRLIDAYLVDEGSPARDEKSVAQFFTTTDNRLQLFFNTDGTFNVLPGEGLNPFPLSGTWAFDLEEAPSKILLTSGGVTTEAPLGAPVRPVDQTLQINFIKRYCTVDGENKPALGYRFVFERQSN
jgi:hypothetical protein